MNGPRICIIGNSGSGKSTLATAIGKELNIPVYHLDRHLLTGNFEKLPPEKCRQVHTGLLAGRSWIIDGNYKKTLPERIERATLVVFLDISRIITIPRVFKRTRNGGQPIHTVPEGAKTEQISWEFFKWTAGYSRRERIRDLKLLSHQANVPLLILKNNSIPELVDQIKRMTR